MSRIIFLCAFLVLSAVIAGTHFSLAETVVDFGSFSTSDVKQSSNKDTLAFVGDVMLARHVEYIEKRFGDGYVFQAMEPVSSSTTLVGNFESAVAREHIRTPDLTFSFATPTSSLAALADYGFEYLSLANNHSYDKGEENFLYAKQQLDIRGITPFGDQVIGETSVTYTEISGKSVALVGVYAVESAPAQEELAVLFAQASELSDFQVAYVHWGVEYELTHSDFQEELAHALVDAGADVVIGHHPHVVQNIASYNGVYIFYSLGNFVFDQYFSQEVQEGLWLELDFSRDVTEYRLRPVTSVGSYSQPRFMSHYGASLFLSKLAKRSEKELSQAISEGVLTEL